jgi:protein gp37
MGVERYKNGFQVTLQPDVLQLPKMWRKPRTIFVNSMSDLFHRQVPSEYIGRVFAVMNECHHHTFQVLTKRSDRLRELAPTLTWTPNIWIGVSVENADYLGRVRDLQAVDGACIRFLSVEPLLGPIEKLPLERIDWVIVGGESGPHARPMQRTWVESILEQCQTVNVPFFFKQWGGVIKARNGRVLNGRTFDEMPRGLAAMPHRTSAAAD